MPLRYGAAAAAAVHRHGALHVDLLVEMTRGDMCGLVMSRVVMWVVEMTRGRLDVLWTCCDVLLCDVYM